MHAKLAALALILALSLAAPALAGPKPGERPAPTKAAESEPGAAMHINMTAQFVFPSARARAVAQISNPEGSAGAMQYTLVIEAAEIARVAGIDCGGSGDIALYSSDEVPVGGGIEEIALSALPSGAALPEGTYRAYMLVKPIGGEGMINAVFRTEVSVKVMIGETAATVGADGLLDLAAHNSRDEAARLELVASAAALAAGGGPDVYEAGAGLKPEDYCVRLFATDEIGAHGDGAWRAIGLPGGVALPAGDYECYLMRVADGQAPYACARVRLNVSAPVAADPENKAWTDEARLGYAQAAVNGAYLLSLATAAQ